MIFHIISGKVECKLIPIGFFNDSKKPPPTSLARAAPGSQASACSSYTGHSAHVMSVRWTALDECLISCGGNDKCVMQWRHVMASNFGGAVTQVEPTSGSKSPGKTVKFALEKGKDSFHLHTDSESEDESNELADDILADSPTGGDEAGAVKPWYTFILNRNIYGEKKRYTSDYR